MTIKPKKIKRQDLSRTISGEQNHRCCYCSCMTWLLPIYNEPKKLESWMFEHNMATLEHVILKTDGGPTHWTNLVMSCYHCNNLRGNRMTADEFFHSNEFDEFHKGKKPYVHRKNLYQRVELKIKKQKKSVVKIQPAPKSWVNRLVASMLPREREFTIKFYLDHDIKGFPISDESRDRLEDLL